MVIVDVEQLGKFVSIKFVLVENTICLGVGSDIVSLVSIEITSDMVDLSDANSCTHKRPT
jgi:hypothetical protein